MSALEAILTQLPTQGLVDLPIPATITVSGPDAKTFLQGQLTVNLNDINSKHASLGAYCDIKGRVVAVFRIIQIDQQYHLLMDPEIIDIATKTLRRYAVFSKVTLDLSPPFSQHIGILSFETLNNLVNTLLPGGVQSITTPEQPDEVVSVPGYFLYKLPGKIQRWGLLIHASSTPLNASFELNTAIWEAFDILSGLPTIKAPTSAHHTAHKLGLIRLNAVSLNKGCYLGQEIVARTQYLGNQKGGLYWASLATPQSFEPNTEISDEQHQPAGNIINCTGINNTLSFILASLKQTPQKNNTYFIGNNECKFKSFFSDDFLIDKI